jgi:uncharacterized protein YecE (DUF72 family)
MAAAPVRIGCSGWSYQSWRGGLYPEGLPQKRWLERYAEAFDTVELNATFYRLPSPEMVAGWADRSPAGFLFAAKGSRYLTHMKRLRDPGPGIERYWERLAPLREAGKLGPVLWQLPKNFHRDDEALAHALEALPPASHCFEFRHPSWFDDEVMALLKDHDAALAIGHDARRPLPEAEPVGPFAYVRFHHGARGRRGNYSRAEIEQWAGRVGEWRRERPVFAYFNNDWEGFAPRNAMALGAALGLPGAPPRTRLSHI